MLIARDQLAEALRLVVAQRIEQGCDLDAVALGRRIDLASGSYDALHGLALELRDPPLRPDWPYVEPLDWDAIVAESDHLLPREPWPWPDLEQAADRVRAAFLGSVCGCMLGKPVEVDPTLAELKTAGERCREWPLQDYVSEAFLDALGRRHESWEQTVRERIHCVAADDDIHYTLIGMLLLERAGTGFDHGDLLRVWSDNLAPGWTWGAERTALLARSLASHHLFPAPDGGGGSDSGEVDALLLNPGDESCGALIRADAYGYGCPGNPDLAAWLAWKDASFTHTRTGVYGAMFIAALIALCLTADGAMPGVERLELAREALRRVPGRCRFTRVVRDCIERVGRATDWQAAYASIHGCYREYSHCRVYQEIGTLINTLRFAPDVGRGICLQVSQGNDTDSFGATAGSLLGALFGPGHLESRWLEPFNNRIQHALAALPEQNLLALAERVAGLPSRVCGDQKGTLSVPG
jgi:ADP-ribosylglycohydrolase